MNLSWGVIPILVEEKTNTDELFEHVVDVAEQHGLVKNGDLAVITAGIPLGVSGTTNMLKVHLVGNVLVSGTAVTHQSVIGRICVFGGDDSTNENFKPGDIIVAARTTNEMLPQLKKAGGVITETDGLNSHAAIVASALDMPVIVGAKNAVSLLKTGTTVKLDGSRGIVFSASAISNGKK